VRKLGKDSDFPLKAFHPLRDLFCVDAIGANYLDRNITVQTRIGGPVHRRHAASPQGLMYLITIDAASGEVWHECSPVNDAIGREGLYRQS
jgi:hypothetical protein